MWITVVLWVVVAALAVVAAVRIVAWDSYDLFAILNSVTAFVYLPAWIVALVAVVGKRYVLAAAALVIVVAQIVFMLPELTAAEPLPGWVATAPKVRLFDANVYDVNPSMAGYAAEIGAYRPQLLTLEEAVPSDVTQLKTDGALAHLPFTIQIRRYDPFAFFIASQYPLTDVHVDYLFGLPLIVKSTVHLPSGPQELWVVHTIGPVPRSFRHVAGPGGRDQPPGAPPGSGRPPAGRGLQQHVEQPGVPPDPGRRHDRRRRRPGPAVRDDLVPDQAGHPPGRPHRPRADRAGRGGHHHRHGQRPG